MREFCFATDDKYTNLKNELDNGKIYKFKDREMPSSCNQGKAALWFGRKGSDYVVCVEKGIKTTDTNEALKSFLESGEKKFATFDELKMFMYSFRPLFTPITEITTKTAATVATEAVTADATKDEDNVVDIKKLEDIRKEAAEPVIIPPSKIAEEIKQNIFGQDKAIEALSDYVSISKLGKDSNCLVVAFLGPTGTGKSETARVLSETLSRLYGTEYGFIEIAGSEFIGEHTVHRFFGAPPGYVGHGQKTILEPVRNNPCHVIVINEIEKANEKLLVGLMEAIDTGKLGMADNSAPIDLNRCIIIFTSNILIDRGEYSSKSAFEKTEYCRDAFTKHCKRPEISGRIGAFLIFEPLSDEARTKIIIKFIKQELGNYDLKLSKIDEYLVSDFLGIETDYGARAIKGMIRDSLGRCLIRDDNLKHNSGKSVHITGRIDDIRYEFVA